MQEPENSDDGSSSRLSASSDLSLDLLRQEEGNADIPGHSHLRSRSYSNYRRDNRPLAATTRDICGVVDHE